MRNTGDDGLAMWSDAIADANNSFRFNTVQVPVLANAIAVYGGASNSVVSNIVADTVTEGGGLHLGNRFGSVAASGVITIANNQAVRAGCVAPDFPQDIAALWFFAQVCFPGQCATTSGRAAVLPLFPPPCYRYFSVASTFILQDENINAAINATGNLLQDSVYSAVLFLGSSVASVVFDGTNVERTGTFVFQFQCGGVASASNVVASGVGYEGVYNCSAPLAFHVGSGNYGWDTWTCGMPPW